MTINPSVREITQLLKTSVTQESREEDTAMAFIFNTQTRTKKVNYNAVTMATLGWLSERQINTLSLTTSQRKKLPPFRQQHSCYKSRPHGSISATSASWSEGRAAQSFKKKYTWKVRVLSAQWHLEGRGSRHAGIKGVYHRGREGTAGRETAMRGRGMVTGVVPLVPRWIHSRTCNQSAHSLKGNHRELSAPC